MKIKEMFGRKKQVLSFEIFPPKKDSALKNIDATLDHLCELQPDFISVTCGAGGSSAGGRTLFLAKKVLERGVEPLVHLTCIHYSREEIVALLDQLADAGIENVLALRGDVAEGAPRREDFRHASDLTAFIKENGDFDVGAACYPETHAESPDQITDIRNLKKKADAGADHLISQLFLDNSFFYDFQEKIRIAGIELPLEAGVMPVTNRAQIRRMISLCGASLPGRVERILDRYGDKPEALFDAGMAYAVSQIVELIAYGVDGVHIFTMNNPLVAKRICEAVKNLI